MVRICIQITAVYFIAAMAIDRCFVASANRVANGPHAKTKYYISALIWILLLGISTPILFFAEVQNELRTDPNDPNVTFNRTHCNMYFAKAVNMSSYLEKHNYYRGRDPIVFEMRPRVRIPAPRKTCKRYRP